MARKSQSRDFIREKNKSAVRGFKDEPKLTKPPNLDDTMKSDLALQIE